MTSRFIVYVLALFATLSILAANGKYSLVGATENCVKLHHHTFSWELFPDVKKVAFKAMFMPPYDLNDVVFVPGDQAADKTALMFRVDQERKTISEWQRADGEETFKEVGEVHLVRKLVHYMGDPMPMVHAEWSRSWDFGFNPEHGKDQASIQMRLFKNGTAEPAETHSRAIQWYNGENECGSSGGHEMPMAFYWSWEVMMFFKGWNTSNFNDFVPAWLFTFVLAFILQVFIYIFGVTFKTDIRVITTVVWIERAISKVIITILSIMQMLLMMTYNVPLLLAIVVGNLLGWLFSVFCIEIAVKAIRDKLEPKDSERQPLLVNDTGYPDECC